MNSYNVKKCIDYRIRINKSYRTDDLETNNLSLLKKIIEEDFEFVSHIDSLKEKANPNIDYFIFPAKDIYVYFTSNNTFDIGIDTVISDNRKVFNPIDGHVIKYEDINASANNVKWYRFSDLCGRKYFSTNSLREIKYSIDFLLERYPDFYTMVFKDGKGKQKRIKR